MFLSLTDCLNNIFHFLTSYELNNVLLTCRELKNIYFESRIWNKLFQRDFSFYDVGGYTKQDILKLECGLICLPCFIKRQCFHHKCDEQIDISNLFKEYYITKRMISSSSSFQKNLKKIRRIDIMRFLAHKFNGITNYLVYKEKEKNIRYEKQKKHQLKTKLKFDRFQNWKLLYSLNNLRFVDSSTSAERLELLQENFRDLNLEIRTDSSLCQDYIKGDVLLYCPQFIAGVMKIVSFLFSYNFEIYNEFHTKLCSLLMYKMFLRQNDDNFTIKDGVEFVIRKNEKRIKRFYENLV
jgi:hypothetical protein